MQSARDTLTPDALTMLQTIARTGSFAAAARAMGMVPSALTYRVRHIEDALDVLLFDRSSRQAKPTAAGQELLREGMRLLTDIDAVANRVKRIASGWEPQLTIAVDTIISRTTVLELCESFFSLGAPTRIRLRDETLSGTLEALTSGQADLALGVGAEATPIPGIHTHALGTVHFVYAVAPHHPLAQATEPLSDDTIQMHRAVAVADSVQRSAALSFGLLSGQDVFTVPSMQTKLQAQLRGMGGGYLPRCMAQSHLDAGRLVEKKTQRAQRQASIYYAWRDAQANSEGQALQWWTQQLSSAVTRKALLEQHRGV